MFLVFPTPKISLHLLTWVKRRFSALIDSWIIQKCIEQSEGTNWKQYESNLSMKIFFIISW